MRVTAGRTLPDSFLTFEVAGSDVQPVSVHVDPLVTVLTSIVEMFGPLSPRVPVAVRRAARTAARWVPVSDLVELTLGGPRSLMVPDFISVDTGSFVEAVEQIREINPAVVAQDLFVYEQFDGAAARRWQRDPARVLGDYCSGLTQYWRDVVIPLYPNLQQRVQREAARLEAGLDVYGYETLLPLLHPRTRFEHGRLTRVDSYKSGPVNWKTRELVIKPMVATPLTCYSNIGAADNPRVTKAFLACAPPNLRPGRVIDATAARPALDLLIGVPRAQILRSLCHRPGTTTDLADELGLLPSTTSYHLRALRSAAVVTSARRRTGVYYQLTERGWRLVAI